MSDRARFIRSAAWCLVAVWVFILLVEAAAHTAPAPPQHTTNPIVFHELKCYPPESAENLICDYPRGPR